MGIDLSEFFRLREALKMTRQVNVPPEVAALVNRLRSENARLSSELATLHGQYRAECSANATLRDDVSRLKSARSVTPAAHTVPIPIVKPDRRYKRALIIGWTVIVAGWLPLVMGLMLGAVEPHNAEVAKRNAGICAALWILSMLAGGPLVLYGRLSEYWNKP